MSNLMVVNCYSLYYCNILSPYDVTIYSLVLLNNCVHRALWTVSLNIYFLVYRLSLSIYFVVYRQFYLEFIS